MSTLGSRLAEARSARFVGRARELAELRRRFEAPEPGVAFVVGPGGVGKTTLLDRFVREVEASSPNANVVRLDARDVEPWPESFLAGLRAASGIEPEADLMEAVAAMERPVVVVDTFELIARLEPWIRNALLPRLPTGAFVVLAGREPPSTEWRTDPGWQGFLGVLVLQNLAVEESGALLERRGVANPALRTALHEVTHGHPLALALVADVALQSGEGAWGAQPPNLGPEIVAILLARFVRDVPSPAHRDALAVCALARATDEALLRATIEPDRGGVGSDAGALHAWLASLSFVQRHQDGLAPHDLVRDVLEADIEQRDRDRRRALARRTRDHFMGHLLAARTQEERIRRVQDMVFVGRRSPGLAGYHTFQSHDTGYGDRAELADHAAILELVREHEGDDAAEIARGWLERAPEAFVVFRSPRGAVVGTMAALWLRALGDAPPGGDPAVDAAFRYIAAHGGLRDGDRVLYLRYWIVRGAYQEVSRTQDLIQARMAMHWFTATDLGWSFVPTLRPELWSPQFRALRMDPAEDAGFEVSGRRYVVHPHDWRTRPLAEWLQLEPREGREFTVKDPLTIACPAANIRPRGDTSDVRAPWAPATREAFTAAVRAALADFVRPLELEKNALVATRIAHQASGADKPRGEHVQRLLRAAAHVLDAHPRDRKLLKALDVTFFRPAGTQERAAEKLGVPFGTYRRHLGRGIERIVDVLWERELAGDAGTLLAAYDDD